MKKLKKQLNNYLSTNSLEKTLTFILFFSTLFVLIYNIFNYKVNFGYDADAHIRYVNAFAMYLPKTFRIPLSYETYEFLALLLDTYFLLLYKLFVETYLMFQTW